MGMLRNPSIDVANRMLSFLSCASSPWGQQECFCYKFATCTKTFR